MPRDRATMDRNQTIMERAEDAAVRDIARAYTQARSEIIARLLDGWTAPGTLRPHEAVSLLHSLGLLREIDTRLRQLERETGAILRGVVDAGSERALEVVSRELMMLPPSLRPNLSAFTRINTAMIERFVPLALSEVEQATGILAASLKREVQAGLLQGEGFPELVGRLMRTTQPSTWRNGANTAELVTRRLVIHAENAARSEVIRQAQKQVPEIKRQAVATIGSKTTQTCLRVHGQIVGVDEPFDLGGYEPQFAPKMMHPGFHWNCRTAVAMHHPSFESGGLTTSNMKSSAQAELRKRREAA